MWIFLALLACSHAFRLPPCSSSDASSARNGVLPSEPLRARSCLGAALTAASPSSPGYAALLRSVQDSQVRLLEGELRGVHSDPDFGATWWELMALMARKSIMNGPELDALASPWDVYLLHGQLACLEERTEGALRSFYRAQRIADSPAVLRLLARISLGRGQPAAALAAALAARSRMQPHTQDRATAALLAMQALAAARVVGAEEGGGHVAATIGADGGASLLGSGAEVVEDEEEEEEEEEEGAAGALVSGSAAAALTDARVANELWQEVRGLVLRRFKEARVALPKGEPLLRRAPPRWLTAPLPPRAPLLGLAAGEGTPLLGNRTPVASPWMRAATPAAAAEWAEKGYTVIRGLLPPAYFEALRKRHRELFWGGGGGGDGGGGGGAAGDRSALRLEPDADQKRRLLWDEELSLFIGTRLLPQMSAIAGAHLGNTYTCSIAYSTGGDLKPHVDREQNAFSMSLNLGLFPEGLNERPWPLYVCPRGAGEEEGVPIRLAPNDALFYGGVHHKHFRHPLEEGTSMQVICAWGFFGGPQIIAAAPLYITHTPSLLPFPTPSRTQSASGTCRRGTATANKHNICSLAAYLSCTKRWVPRCLLWGRAPHAPRLYTCLRC